MKKMSARFGNLGRYPMFWNSFSVFCHSLKLRMTASPTIFTCCYESVKIDRTAFIGKPYRPRYFERQILAKPKRCIR